MVEAPRSASPAKDPVPPGGGHVDVALVMRAVRDAVRRRREDRATPTETAVAERLADLADESGIDPDLLYHLLTADGRWNISPDYRVVTHRRGLAARAVLFLKSFVRPLVRLYTDPIVVRQAEVNLYLLHTARSLLVEVTRLERTVADLEARLAVNHDPSRS
jgi:hypothetical protein